MRADMPARPGSLVRVRDQQWRLARVVPYDHCAIVVLDGGDDGRRLQVIEPFDRVASIRADRMRRRGRRNVLRHALAAIGGARPALGLWTAAAAPIDLLPYQLEPALAVLRGATRVLLADAVGLGKTIQAGLILAELRERGWADRALVLCPAGLRAMWAAELERRFRIPCGVVDQAAMAERTAVLPPGVNPWSSHATIVASIDFVKRPEVLAALGAISIDVLIADEAHHLTPGTDRASAVAQLAARAPWCVLASATPHSGDVAAYNFLTGLGEHRERLAVFRRTRQDAGFTSERRERLLRVAPSSSEAALLAAVDAYAQAIWRARGRHDPAAQLVAITIARRAASSPLALERTLQRRLALLSAEPVVTQSSLPWEEDDEADGAGEAAVLSTPGLDSDHEERAVLGRLLTSIAGCGPGAKLRRLGRLLARVREPAIVFTEYRDSVEAILGVLPVSRRAAAISGALTVDERRDAIDAFTRGDLDVLVATDAAGEGLNLHHRCRLVVDLELPWNPLRLEQRIGRVDRLGQRRRVHAIRLFHPGTIEQRVLDRMQARRRKAGLAGDRDSIGDLDMGRAVFEGHEPGSTVEPRSDAIVIGQAAAEAQRLTGQRARAWLDRADGGVWARPGRRGRSSLIALHAISCTTAHGGLVAEQPFSCRVEARRPARASDWRPLIEHGVAAVAQGLIERAVCEACAATDRELAPVRHAVSARIGGIRGHLAAERVGEQQLSLFDRRADESAGRDARAAAILDEALERCLRSVISPAVAADSAARLVAIWPVPAR